MNGDTVQDGKVTKEKQSRARKTCHKCHERKTKCDVARRGTPCTSCIELAATCVVRRRKNARIRISSPGGLGDTTQHQDFGGEATGSTESDSRINHPSISNQSPLSLFQQPQHPQQRRATFANDGQFPTPSNLADNSLHLHQPPPQIHGDPPSIGSSTYHDLTTLADMEEIFNTTWDSNFTGFIATAQQAPAFEVMPGQHANTTQPGSYGVSLAHNISIDPSHLQFLESQGCFTLPSTSVLRELLKYYFSYVHPNLPVVEEDKVWSLFNGSSFALGNFSYLVIRAMLFASVHFLSPEILQTQLGFANKREARQALYAQARLLFSFNVEQDPIRVSQACLILTYYAPSYNFNRVNALWLTLATHYARIAQANAFPIVQETDPDRGRLLKRLWWGLIFRDRILSLGLRRPLIVEQPASICEEQHFLHVSDFQPEIGNSAVHDTTTQYRLIEIMTSMCRLIQILTPALNLLYRSERIDQRLADVKFSSYFVTMSDIRRSLEALYAWHARASLTFPSPLTLDLDEASTGSTSVFGNMLFVCYDSAIFALNQHRVLIEATTYHPENQLASDASAVGAMENAANDISMRMQEVLQARLSKFLPISVSAFISLPLVLQAINVTAARGDDSLESIESRKLEVLTRILENQVLHFDGSDFIGDILTNIIQYTKNGMLENGSSNGNGHSKQHSARHSSQWPELMRKRPRLLLRLLLRLDGTLCSGSIVGVEDSFPPELRS